MSSVSGSDSSGSAAVSAAQNDSVRRNREEAQKTEGDLAKKQAKEIRRLNEDHYSEVENLKKAHEAQMNDLKQNSHDAINERDHRYQKEIEDVRELYRKQLQSQADNSAQREELLTNVKSTENDSDKVRYEDRLKKLSEDYQTTLNRRDQSFQENIAQGREAQQNAISENRRAITQHYQDENRMLSDDRKTQVGTLQKNFDDYRKSSDSQMRDQEIRNMHDKQRESDALLRTVTKERQSASDSNETLREGFKDGLHKTQERFGKAYARDRAATEFSRQQLKDSTSNRVENEIQHLKIKNADLQDDRERSEVKLKQQQQVETGNLVDSYQKNIENYREQRDAVLGENNERMHKAVEKVHRESDDQAVSQSRFYRGEQDLQTRINRKAIDDLKGSYEVINNQTKAQADTRVKTIFENATDENSRLSNLQVENHAATQRAHQDEMAALRAKLESDKLNVVGNLQEHMQKLEIQHSERMAQVVGKYEKQIQGLTDQLVQQKRQSDETLKRTVDDLQRVHKTNLDQLEAQNRDRSRQMELVHSEEIRTANKRNDERINQVLAEIKKT